MYTLKKWLFHFFMTSKWKKNDLFQNFMTYILSPKSVLLSLYVTPPVPKASWDNGKENKQIKYIYIWSNQIYIYIFFLFFFLNKCFTFKEWSPFYHFLPCCQTRNKSFASWMCIGKLFQKLILLTHRFHYF